MDEQGSQRFDVTPQEDKPLGYVQWSDGHRVNFFSMQRAKRLTHTERDFKVYRTMWETIYPGWEPPEVRWKVKEPTMVAYKKLVLVRERPSQVVYHERRDTAFDLFARNLTGEFDSTLDSASQGEAPPPPQDASSSTD